jgi:hypothetical protein
MYDYIILIVVVLLLGMTVSREGFSCSVEKCRADQSFIKRDKLFCCFDPTGDKENIVSTHDAYSDCLVEPGKNRMTLFDAYGTPVVYDRPASYNCNPYNVLVTKK